MKGFYQNLVDRWLACETWGASSATPLEKIIYQECGQEADAMRMHDHNLRLMLKDIARREADARRFGEGEEDWVVAAFLSSLGPCREDQTLMDRETMRQKSRSAREYRTMLRSQRNGWAADVYPLLRKGHPSSEIGAILGISEQEVKKAERRLLMLYDTASAEHPEVSLRNPEVQTYLTLADGAYRVFRREATGVVQYRFYCRDRFLGSGYGLVAPDFPMVLRWEGMILNSSFSADQTIFPGLSRKIIDADNATAEFARLTYLKAGSHCLELYPAAGTIRFQIQSQEEKHRIYQEDRLVAELLPLPLPQRMGDWEIRYCLKPHEKLSDEAAMLLLSFPLLRFAP